MLAVLSLLMGFASISTDLYLPALPTMARALGASSGQMEWTISSYLIGFSLGQLVWGPIGDRVGRRLPVALGVLLFIIGSAGCALSGNVWQIVAWRVVQATGACAGVVLARAMVRDLYQGDRAAQMLSTLVSVMAIAPLLGPIAGAQILTFASWRAIFWTLVAIGVATLIALATVPETLREERRPCAPASAVLAGYFTLLGQRSIIGFIAAGAFFYGGVYAYIAGSPFAYITFYHVTPPLYAVLFASGIVGIIAFNQINARLVRRIGLERSLRLGGYGLAAAAITLAVNAATGVGGLWLLACALFVFAAMNGFIVANSIAGAMRPFPDRAGAVSALVGALQYGAGILSSSLVGLFADGTPRPMVWVIALCGAGAALSKWFAWGETTDRAKPARRFDEAFSKRLF
jgi:DHA1 family bicyclomycin/chloramphenicol resistance-like MFS transporter